MSALSEFITDVFKAINTQVVIVLALILFRKNILLILNAISNKLGNISSLDIKNLKVDFQRLEQKVDDNEKLVVDTVNTGFQTKPQPKLTDENASNYATIIKSMDDKLKSYNQDKIEHEVLDTAGLIKLKLGDNNPAPVTVLNDPQKGRWGQKAEDKNRKLSATIEPVTNGLFKLIISVVSTSPLDPLKGKVTFHLHDSFSNPNPIVDVQNGEARLVLLVWGSFVVGVETDNNTMLEYDLATIPGAPSQFINN